MLYKIRNGLIKYAANTVLDNINFEIRDTEKIAIIGRNGCGKSTLLKLIAGIITLDNLDSDEESYIHIAGKPRIGYLTQMSFLDETILVYDELCKVFEPVFHLEEKINELIKIMEFNSEDEVLIEYDQLQSEFLRRGGYTYERDIETIFTKFGFALDDLQRPIGTFSGGQKTKLNFIKLLLSKPDIMLLDEPTNHLDVSTIIWLEGYLRNYDKAVVIVSHDRMFLDKISDITYEIEHMKMKRYPGNYSYFEKMKHLNYEKQEKEYQAQQKEIARLLQLVERFKNTPSKVAMTRSKLKQIEHMPVCPPPARYDLKSFHSNFTPKKEGGHNVLNVKNLQIGYDTILSEINLSIKKGDRVAIIGDNGKGKSTFIKTIMNQIPALGGTFSFGHEIEPGYFAQELVLDNSDKTVIQSFWDTFPNLTQTEVRNSLGSFLFTKDEVFQNVSTLSGGEKVRLYLATMLKTRPNFLILDEPTNHMDIVGKETLEEMLLSLKGTLLCVSHDRYFIKKIANALLVFENDTVNYYPHGYEEYEELKAKENISYGQIVSNKLSASTSTHNNCFKDKGDSQLTDFPKNFNPLKEESKVKKKIQSLEVKIDNIEITIDELKEQLYDPINAIDYEKLSELTEKIVNQEQILEALMKEWSTLLA